MIPDSGIILPFSLSNLSLASDIVDKICSPTKIFLLLTSTLINKLSEIAFFCFSLFSLPFTILRLYERLLIFSPLTSIDAGVIL